LDKQKEVMVPRGMLAGCFNERIVDLCERCIEALNDFVKPLPKATSR
jgi:hypothetical protein